MKPEKLSSLVSVGIFCMAVGSAAFANDKPSHVPGEYCPHAKTRTQVITELAEARSQGLLSHGETDFPKMPEFVSTTTRAQVVAQLNDARIQGLLSYNEADFPKMPKSVPAVPTATRAQVVAELDQARVQGLIKYSEADFAKPLIVPNCG